MNPLIQIRHDQRRGCGWRKPGGLYLVAPKLSAPCCKLPFPLSVCPCCGEGIRPSRGFTWISLNGLMKQQDCVANEFDRFPRNCPLEHVGDLQQAPEEFNKVGLIWVGEQFYPELKDFTEEAARQGISRRISGVPRGFELGKTWIALAHRKAYKDAHAQTDEKWVSAIFMVFQPTAIEYVTTGEEPDEVIRDLVNRGITPVKIAKPAPKSKPFS